VLRPKEDSYYQGIREDIIELVGKDMQRILDVGCAFGMTGERLKKQGSREVIGIEADPRAYNEAKRRLDKVFLGDVEKLKLPFRDGYFDCIIYADILEHLIDPWSILHKHKTLLKSGGSIIASIPNIRHYRVIKRLKKGNWDYDEKGVLDSTHLRFFTKSSIEKMFKEAGFRIDGIKYKISASKVKKFINQVLSGRLNEVLSEQFLIKATKV